ncbi:MAG: hypothetical protein ACE5FZ_08125 [Nitrospiria bacterium]
MGDYPLNGGHNLFDVSLDTQNAGSAAQAKVIFRNQDAAPAFGWASARLSWTAGRGRDEGQTATGNWVPFIQGARFRTIQMPIPGTGLPLSDAINLQVEVVPGKSETGTAVINQRKVIPLKYVDVAVLEIGTNPSVPHVLPLPAGAQPVEVKVTDRREGLQIRYIDHHFFDLPRSLSFP